MLWEIEVKVDLFDLCYSLNEGVHSHEAVKKLMDTKQGWESFQGFVIIFTRDGGTGKFRQLFRAQNSRHFLRYYIGLMFFMSSGACNCSRKVSFTYSRNRTTKRSLANTSTRQLWQDTNLLDTDGRSFSKTRDRSFPSNNEYWQAPTNLSNTKAMIGVVRRRQPSWCLLLTAAHFIRLLSFIVCECQHISCARRNLIK